MFDAATVADEATYADPARYPIGIDHVFVNGRAGDRRRRRDRRARRPTVAAGLIALHVTATETDAVAQLPGGPIAYTLRRSPRSRGLRVVIHPDRGMVVTVPLATRRGWANPERPDRGVPRRARAVGPAPPGPAGARSRRARGPRRLARRRHDPVPGRPPPPAGRAVASGRRRSTVERIGGADEDELIVHLAPADRRSIAAVLEAWLKPRARAAIEREVARHAAALGVSPTALSVRDQRTRWGSASRQGRLAFSWRLVLAPPEALETVVIHELAHLRVFGHGPRFWEVVASRRPDHKMWRRWLRDHSTELHGALDDAVS